MLPVKCSSALCSGLLITHSHNIPGPASAASHQVPLTIACAQCVHATAPVGRSDMTQQFGLQAGVPKQRPARGQQADYASRLCQIHIVPFKHHLKRVVNASDFDHIHTVNSLNRTPQKAGKHIWTTTASSDVRHITTVGSHGQSDGQAAIGKVRGERQRAVQAGGLTMMGSSWDQGSYQKPPGAP